MSRDELMDRYFERVHDVSLWIGISADLTSYYQGHANAIAGIMYFANHITTDEFKNMFLHSENF